MEIFWPSPSALDRIGTVADLPPANLQVILGLSRCPTR